jgi:MFS family permease
LISIAATFSPLSSFIFFPATNGLSQSLHVSVGRINLTITSYMIVAGLAPSILGDLADNIGRRIVYLLMMSILCSQCWVGLAKQLDGAFHSSNDAECWKCRYMDLFGNLPFSLLLTNIIQPPLPLATGSCRILPLPRSVVNMYLGWSLGMEICHI